MTKKKKKKRGTIEKYQFPGIKCKIDGCNNPVFMSKTVGLCCLHKGRASTGRMLENGDLVEVSEYRACISCGVTFFVKGKAVSSSKYCSECRGIEKKKVGAENRHDHFRIGPNDIEKYNERIRKKYLLQVLKLFVAVGSPCTVNPPPEKREKSFLMMDMRDRGIPLRDIGIQFGISGERVRQIIRDGF